jgi:hypothetical protein
MYVTYRVSDDKLRALLLSFCFSGVLRLFLSSFSCTEIRGLLFFFFLVSACLGGDL